MHVDMHIRRKFSAKRKTEINGTKVLVIETNSLLRNLV